MKVHMRKKMYPYNWSRAGIETVCQANGPSVRIVSFPAMRGSSKPDMMIAKNRGSFPGRIIMIRDPNQNRTMKNNDTKKLMRGASASLCHYRPGRTVKGFSTRASRQRRLLLQHGFLSLVRVEASS